MKIFRIKNFLKILLFCSLIFSLSSCGPVYKIGYDYHPPQTTSGLQCIRGCQSQLNQCNSRCSARFNQCSIKAENQAKRNLPRLLIAYPQQLKLWQNSRDQYLSDLDWYEFRHDMAQSRRDFYLENCYRNSKKKSECGSRFSYHHNFLSDDKPSFNIPRPVKPTLVSEAAKIRKLSCSKDCGCKSNYRLCYTSCGGVVSSKKICVKNCGK